MKAQFALALLAAAGLSNFCAAQAISFGASKAGNYLQTADGVVNPYNDFNCVLSISGDQFNSFSAGEVTYAGPLSPLAMVEVGNTPEGGNVWYGYSTLNASIADLDAEFPAGLYTFSFTGNVLAGGTHPFNLRPSHFCPEIPELLGDTYSRLQDYKNDLTVDFTGSMSGFTDSPGANASATSFIVYDVGRGGVFYSNSLPPSDTSFTIPGNSIEAGRAYYGVMYYSTSYNDAGAGIGGGRESTSFSRNVFFYFNTRGPCPADLNGDGVVEDADFVIFLQSYNLLYCSDPAVPDKCPADLTNDGYVQDDDFSIFVVAYDELLCP